MDDITQKFLDRLKDLVALGKKKKSILDVQEINDFFNDMELNADQMEKVFDLRQITLMCCALAEIHRMRWM